MTTQHARLAAVMHDYVFPEALHHCFHSERYSLATGRQVVGLDKPCERFADALLARGVRVVDVDTLAAAMAQLPEYAETPSYQRQAIELLAALTMGETR